MCWSCRAGHGPGDAERASQKISLYVHACGHAGMHIRGHSYMQAWPRAILFVCVQICVCMHECVRMHVHMHAHVRARAIVHARACAHACTRVCVRVCTCRAEVSSCIYRQSTEARLQCRSTTKCPKNGGIHEGTRHQSTRRIWS